MQKIIRFAIAVVITLAAVVASPILPRINSVYVSSSGNVAYAQGTAASTSIAPTLPNGVVPLANLSIASSEIIDQRMIKPDFANMGIVNVKDFGAKGDGVTNDTAAIQLAVDVLEARGGGTLSFPDGDYSFTGITIKRPISLKGNSPAATKFKNSGTGRMISYDYWNVGLSDQNKRNWVTVENITFKDSASYNGTGVYAYHVVALEFKNCFFIDFKNGFATDIEEGLWVDFNNVNTDKSPVRVFSYETPHNANVISFNGGEYRNAASSAIYIYNADVVSVNNIAIEGQSGTPTAGLFLEKVKYFDGKNLYFEHVENAIRGVIYTKDCSAISISHSLVASNSDRPAIYSVNTSNIELEKNYLANPIIAEADCGHIVFNECLLYGKTDIADGVFYEINSPEPGSAVAIPINPLFQPSKIQHKGIALSNRYADSSFRTGIPTVVQSAGLPVATHDATTGYYDNNSLKIEGMAGDKALIQGLGRIEATGQGAIISFMAKAETAADFTFTPSIAVASGSAIAKITTTWRRYHIISLMQGTQTALATVSMWAKFSNTNKIWIDDVQVTPINSYAEVPKYIDNFRYIYTHGTMILNDDKAIVPYAPYFDAGIQFRKWTYAPSSPQEGTVYFADGISWDPGSGKGLYFYDGSIYTKL